MDHSAQAEGCVYRSSHGKWLGGSLALPILVCTLACWTTPLLGQEEVRPVGMTEPSPTYQPVQLFESEVKKPSPREQMGGMGMGMMGRDGNDGGPGYFMQYQPGAAVAGQGTDLGFVRQQLRFGMPIYRDDVNTVILNGAIQNHWFQGSAVLPNTGRDFPESLWNIRAGPMWMRKLDDGWMLGVMTGVTIASDEPFEHSRDVNGNVMAFLRVPANETDAWLFSVFYAPLSELPFPLPMVSYQYQPSEEWRLNIGVPFSISYRPCSEWSFDFNWMPVRTFRLNAGYRMTERLQLFARWQWMNESWFLSDRTENRDRLFYYEMSITGGVRYQILDRLTAEVGAGYAFDRYFFQGDGYEDRRFDRVDLEAGFVLNAGLSLRF